MLISLFELLTPWQRAGQFDNDAKWIIFINEVHNCVRVNQHQCLAL